MPAAKKKEATLNISRRVENRRAKPEQRDSDESFEGDEVRSTERRKGERRRQIDPTTCERDYTNHEVDFMKAMDDYKRKSGRQFPTWSEVLEVLYAMGYRRVEEPTEIEIISR
ncbi:hypothetical protein Pla110_17140 [Polystyrenella longa]|uniref:Uncharacterized protein n=1 Tax=Polystyrenella longa TaxID=2528007 RepID=A0A518CL87_9PLAN|nr:hypothetical protein [Polystyrenella longa]QDU79992.1 hypothetical protein Pla110_17140 [Polystyrenella longa]